jgi:hypothetical protein
VEYDLPDQSVLIILLRSRWMALFVVQVGGWLPIVSLISELLVIILFVELKNALVVNR